MLVTAENSGELLGELEDHEGKNYEGNRCLKAGCDKRHVDLVAPAGA